MAPHSSTLAWKIPWTEAAVHGVAKSRTRLSDFTFPFQFHALEKEMETQSSALAWRIPGTAEPGGLPSLGLHRVGHDGSDLAASASLQAIQRVRPLAWIISCLTQRVEWETVMCVSTLDLEHPEEQYSLVWGCFFFFTRGSASQRGPRFHSDREMVSFPDAGMLVDYRPGLFKLGTIDVLGQIILCYQGRLFCAL